MDSDEEETILAACLAMLGVPFKFVFVCKDGLPVRVQVVAQKQY